MAIAKEDSDLPRSLLIASQVSPESTKCADRVGLVPLYVDHTQPRSLQASATRATATR